MLTRITSIVALTFIGTASLAGQNLLPLVYEMEEEWLVDIPAGGSGYGSQLAIIDKKTGLVRSYESYEFEGDPIQEPSWQTNTERLPAPVDGLAPLVGGYQTELLLPLRLENRLGIYAVDGFPIDEAISVPGIGPEAVVSFPAVPEQGQSEPVLFVQSGLNSPPESTQHTALLSPGLGRSYGTPVAADFRPFQVAITFPRDVGTPFDGDNALLAFADHDDGTLRLARPVLDGLKMLAERPFAKTGRLLYGDFLDARTRNQILVYVPGSSTFYVYEITDEGGDWGLSEPIAFEASAPVQMATRLEFEGQLALALHYKGTRRIEIFLLGPAKPVAKFDLAGDQELIGLVSVGGDRVFALSGENGRSSDYELFGADEDGDWRSLFTGTLPMDGFDAPASAGSPQLFFFDQSPLRSSSAQLLGWYSGSGSTAWGSEPKEVSTNVQFQAWVDSNPAAGLEKSFASSTRLPDDSKAFLANQVNAAASISGLGIFGSAETNFLTSWSPRPGSYESLSRIEASFPAGAELLYRFGSDTAWQAYRGAFFPPAEHVSIEYFLRFADGSKGPIRTVDYHFAPLAFNADSNGDGIPDYVQAALGLDPFGTGDSDGDGFSDLDEINAGTSASDPDEFPAVASSLDRGLEENIRLSSQNTSGSFWAAGSTGFVDRVTGQRLGRAVVPDGQEFAEFDGLATLRAEGMLALSTEFQYFFEGDAAEAPSGWEFLHLISVVRDDSLTVDRSYTGGSIETAASAWVSGLVEADRGSDRRTRRVDLTVQNTAFALALEYAIEQELEAQGYLDVGAQLSLFPNRPGEDRWLNVADVAAQVDAENGAPRFTVPELWGHLNLAATFEQAESAFAGWTSWPLLCETVYQRFNASEITPVVGESPVDVLRALLRGQDVPDDLLTRLSLDPATATAALAEGRGLGSVFVEEAPQTFDLTIVDTNAAGCFLASDDFSQIYSLFDESGERFVPSKSVDFLPDTRIRVRGFLRSEWNACDSPGLEVNSLRVLEFPQALSADADGNLLDDNWELYWIGTSGSDPFESIDGSGYSLLQKFLSGRSATDAQDLPSEPIKDLSPPDVLLELTGHNEVTLSWDWPGAYSDRIRFKLLNADELGNLSAVQPVSVDYTRAGDSHEMILTVPESDHRFFKLVLSL